jgi:leucyl-tRNA synthetase
MPHGRVSIDHRRYQVTLAVLLNGKLRDTVTARRGLDRAEWKHSRWPPTNQRQLARVPPHKVIVVPDRLVNIVA